jgi:competence protein ComEC
MPINVTINNLVKHILPILIILLSILTLWESNYGGEIMRINMLDVGQGDSIYVESPDKYSLLIDVGYDNSVVFELSNVKSNSIDQIDYLVLTHFDFDHVGGLAELLKRYRIGLTLLPYVPESDESDYKIIELLLDYDIPFVAVVSGEALKLGCCVDIDFIWPPTNQNIYEPNDSSIGMILTYNDFNLYAAGDLSANFELDSLQNIDIDFEILKVGHHGSKTSTTIDLLEKIDVEYALISAGLDNRYGHPHPEVLDMLEVQGAQHLGTYEHGTITVHTDGYAYSIGY